MAHVYDERWLDYQCQLVFNPLSVRDPIITVKEHLSVVVVGKLRTKRAIHITLCNTQRHSFLYAPRTWLGAALWLECGPTEYVNMMHSSAPLYLVETKHAPYRVQLGLDWQTVFASSGRHVVQRLPSREYLVHAREQCHRHHETTVVKAPKDMVSHTGYVSQMVILSLHTLWDVDADVPPLQEEIVNSVRYEGGDLTLPSTHAGDLAVHEHTWLPVPVMYDAYAKDAPYVMQPIGVVYGVWPDDLGPDEHYDLDVSIVKWDEDADTRVVQRVVRFLQQFSWEMRADCTEKIRTRVRGLRERLERLERHGRSRSAWSFGELQRVLYGKGARANALHFITGCSEEQASLFFDDKTRSRTKAYLEVQSTLHQLDPGTYAETDRPLALWFNVQEEQNATVATTASVESLYACRSCGSRNNQTLERQTRSADEGMTLYTQCFNCAKTTRAVG